MRPPYPPDAASFRFDGASPRPNPRGLGQFGLFLFLVSLTMFFAAGLAAYLLVRYRGIASALEDASLRIPAALWVSTALLLISTGTAHLAARLGRTRSARTAVVLTFALGLLFVGVQIPALIELLTAHYAAGRVIPGLYGLAFTLILLHALHVVGGLIPLTALTLRALRNQLTDHQRNRIRAVAAYWHFLDAVWLALFATFLLTA